jgi:pyrroline-5-carboxylate reductase
VDVLFLAVHPPVVKEITAEISGKMKPDTIVVSLIPVISIEKLSGMLGGARKLVRMIPNAPALIHKGYNPVVYSADVSTDEKQQLRDLFNHWGEAPEVDEQKLEAYAIVSAMGPTYFWFQWLKLYELGKQFGLSETELRKAIPALLHGATETLFESGLPPKEVLDLIPVCPLKKDESTIQAIFDKKLPELYAKLTPR